MGRAEVLAELDPELRRTARFVPLGVGIERRLWLVRRASHVLGMIGSVRGVEQARTPGNVAIRLHRPDLPGQRPGLLWLHGGGTVLGDASEDDRWCRHLSTQLGAVVVAVDYRLAPEHPFPAPVDDCVAAHRWLVAQPGIDPARVAVAGASAGGLLAVAATRRAIDAGGPPVAALGLVYPMLDDRTGTPGSGRRHLLWSESDNRAAWRSYVSGADPFDAAPARWSDLTGLPPTWVGVGTADLFHDEDLAFAQRLGAAGVPTTVEIADGAYHGFDQISPDAQVSRRFRSSLVDHLASALAD